MSSEFHNLENSLKEFLSIENSDKYSSQKANFYKYNNLKLFIDNNRCKDPHFIVRIGMSESIYDINTCEKLSGGLGPDEKNMRKWYEKPYIKTTLMNCWNQAQRAVTVQMKNYDESDE